MPLTCLVALLLGLNACAANFKYTTVDDIPRAPNLPPREEVAAIGLRAVQMLIVAIPDMTEAIQRADTHTATLTWVNLASKLPTERVIASPAFYQATVYALAHQWGVAQHAIDYLRRYEVFLEDRIATAESKKASLAWSNFFAGLSTVGYAMSNASANQTYANRLSNELAISRNTQTMQANTLLSELHSAQVTDFATVKHKVREVKEQLTAHAKLLEIYRGWLYEAVEKQEKEIPKDAMRILEVKLAL